MPRVTVRLGTTQAVGVDYAVAAAERYGPRSITRGDEVSALQLTGVTPAYPTWARTLGQDKPLGPWLSSLASSQIPMLPEDELAWWFDSTPGFGYPGVTHITEGAVKDSLGAWSGGTKRAVSSHGTGWCAFHRLSSAGLAGMGPGSKVVLGPSAYSSPVQRRGELHHMTNGTVQEKIGCQEKFLEVRGGYVGNLVIEGRPLGGVAYNLLGCSGNVPPRLEQLIMRNTQGGIPAPNTEAAALAGFPAGTRIRRVLIEGSGSSPIMANGPAGDANLLIEDVWLKGSDNGMLALWNMQGLVTLRNVRAEGTGDGGINVEKTRAVGLTVNWEGGSILVDKPGGGYYDLHVKIGESQTGSAKINLIGVTTDNGPWPGSVSVQMWGQMGKQRRADVTCDNKPIRFTSGSVLL